MSKRSTAGFTLVEVIIVMAISSALAAAALTGFSALRGQAQFSDSVERLKENVLVKRTEALTTVKLSGGADTTRVTFGKLLTFNPGSGVVQVQTLSTSSTASPTAGQAVNVVAAETTSFTMAWGLTFAGVSRTQVAFVRATTDGALISAVSTGTGFAGYPGPYQYGSFTGNPNAAPVNLNFQDPSGRRAFLTIIPAQNGVTRTFQ